MNKRVVWVCLVVGILVAGVSSAVAKGPCKVDVDVILCAVPNGIDEVRVVALLDKQCANEGKKCRGQASCETVYTEVMCGDPADGDPGVTTIGLGCFCGGGSPPVFLPRQDPVSADEAVRMIEAIEAAEAGNPALCEAPLDLTAK
jgi:hypothetical protein